MKIAIIAASHSMAQQLIHKISHKVDSIHALARKPEKLKFQQKNIESLYCDLEQADSIGKATQGCDVVISLAHSRYTKAILDNISESVRRVIIVGSTWKYTRFANVRAEQVRRAEEVLHAWCGESVMIHPTMIYGAKEEDTLRKLVDWVSRKSWVPLPDGGKTLVQPAFSDDIVDALEASIFKKEMSGRSFVVASHSPISYRQMVLTCAEQQNRKVHILNVPTSLMKLGAQALSLTPWKNRLKTDQVDRLTEDKDFDVTPLEEVLGRPLHSFDEGLKKVLSRSASQ